MEEPWSEPSVPQPANPLAGAGDRLSALRKNITGKLQETTAKLAEAKGLELPTQLGQKLDEAKRELGQSGLGLVAKGVVAGVTGTGELPPTPEQQAEALAFSRQAFLDELAAAEAEKATASRKRMAFIVAYIRDAQSNPLFADKPLMYKILTEERTYQQQLLADARQQQAQLPPSPLEMGVTAEELAADPKLVAQEARRTELKKLVTDASTIQSQIFLLLQKLTGAQNAKAGMDFVAEAEPQVADDASMADALDAVNQVLAKRKKP